MKGIFVQALFTEVSSTLSRSVPGTSFFHAGHAHEAKQGLVARRKEVQWFAGRHGSSYTGLPYDVGEEPTPRYGLTGVSGISELLFNKVN